MNNKRWNIKGRIFIRCFLLAVCSFVLGACKKNDLTKTELTTKELFENDFVLYQVQCGANESNKNFEQELGLFQSKSDQVYGKDLSTEKEWGYVAQDYMIATTEQTNNFLLETKWEIGEDFFYDINETGFTYLFEVPNGEYEVICGFYNPFSARTVDIKAEGEPVIENMKILKFKETTGRFEQTVDDGVLELKIYNPNRGNDPMKNPILSYIIVKQVPQYSMELLTLLLEKAQIPKENENQYTEETKNNFTKAYERALEILNSTEGSSVEKPSSEETILENIEKAFIELENAYHKLELLPFYKEFSVGEEWRDMDGNIIQAHGGQVQKITVKDEATGQLTDKWWWIGEDKTEGYRGGIRAYSSDDLYNWKSEGIVMRNVDSREQLEEEEYFQELYIDYNSEELDRVYECINSTTSVIERPKMIYNKLTGLYVIWFHADGPTHGNDSNYAAASAGVAISESPKGPFRFIDRYRLNTCPPDQEDMFPESKGMARDMNLFVDEDGSAYIIYSSEENLTIYISRLNETYDYLATEPEEAVYAKDFIRLYPGAQREAPAIVKRNGYYYLITSGATGWDPNQARYWRSEEILGEWEERGDPCNGDTKKTTFDSQSTCIFQVDEDTYIYMGDRWNAEDLANSRYVWLPVEFDENNNLTVKWETKWKWQKVGGKE